MDLKSISDELNKAVIENERVISSLRKENKRLKDFHYKDKELQLMKDELERMRADLNRGFPITVEDKESIDKWHEIHKFRCPHSYYQYVFTENELIDYYEVKCRVCGDTFTFKKV